MIFCDLRCFFNYFVILELILSIVDEFYLGELKARDMIEGKNALFTSFCEVLNSSGNEDMWFAIYMFIL